MMSNTPNIEALRKVAEEAPALIAYYLRRGPDDLGVGEVERLLTTSSALLSELEAVKGANEKHKAGWAEAFRIAYGWQERCKEESFVFSLILAAFEGRAQAAKAALVSLKEERDEAWRCFHCDFTTSDRAEAELHFGPKSFYDPMCKMTDAGQRREYINLDASYSRVCKDKIAAEARAQAAEQALSELKGEVLEKVGPLLREARTELFALCEATEDECIAGIKRLVDGDEIPAEFVHQVGFYRGRKSEAKAISRAMGEVYRELLSTLYDKLSIEVRPTFEIGSRVQPRGGGLVEGELLEFNADGTGALIRWNSGDEIWKALRNLEVVAPPNPSARGEL